MANALDRRLIDLLAGGNPRIREGLETLVNQVQEVTDVQTVNVDATSKLEDATVLTLSPNASFQNERILAVGKGLSLVDDGAKLAIKFTDGAVSSTSGFNVQFIPQGDSALVLPLTGTLATTSDIPAGFSGAYADLTGIPSTFAPSAHTHPQSDITGLTGDLAGLDTRLDTLEAKVTAAHLLCPVPSGNYFDQSTNAVAKSTIAGAANRLDLFPFIGGNTVILQSIGIEVSTAVAASQARVGIYSDNAGLPDALLANSGLLDCSTTGAKQGAITQTLTAGVRYWLAVLSSAAQTYRGVPVAAMVSLGVPAAGGAPSHTVRRATQTFASGLPPSAPAGVLTSAIVPMVMMRAA